MKLSHYDSGTLAEPEFSELEILKMENEYLRDEFRIQELEKSLEIYEAIFDCVKKTGGITKSLEIMFGENVSSSENMLEELKIQYNSALEALTNIFASVEVESTTGTIERLFLLQVAKAKNLASRAKKVMKYMADVNHWGWRIELNGIASAIRSVARIISSKINDNNDDPERIQKGLAKALIGEDKLSEFVHDEGHEYDTIHIESSIELAKILQALSVHNPFLVSNEEIKKLFAEINSKFGVDARFWANYDDAKIERLRNILARGVIMSNMQILRFLEDKIKEAEADKQYEDEYKRD